jgi:hypothetical protein
MRKISILTILITIICSCGEKDRPQSEAEKFVEKFFSNYKKEGPRTSLKMILSSNKYISSSVADTVAIKLERLANGLGHFQGFEKVNEVCYGESIFLLTYLVKYTQQPLRFKFKFYQPGNGLRLQDFSFESDFLDEVEDEIKREGIHPVDNIE